MKYKQVYLDTNVIRDCYKRRKKESILLLKNLKENNIKCTTSIFTNLELLDIEQESFYFFKQFQESKELNFILGKRNKRDLSMNDLNGISNKLELFYEEYDFINTIDLIGEGWQWAVDIARMSNITSGDALHLATAIGSKCDLLITGDKHFIKEAKTFLDDKENGLEICHTNEAWKEIERGLQG